MKTRGAPGGAQAYADAHRRRNKWLTAVICMAALVVFCTVYALVMPAATLEGDTYCGVAEHTHTEECYESVLSCGLEEGEEHTHDESCYEDVLTCELPEHTHTAECYVNPEEAEDADTETADTAETEDTETVDGETAEETADADGDTETAAPGRLISEGTDYSVTVDYGEDAGLPEGTALAVSEYETDSDTYQERYEQAAELASLTDGASDSFRLFDISLLSEGQEVEPAAAVDVAVTYHNAESFAAAYDLQVFHFTEDGVERVEDTDLAVDEDSGTLTIRFTAESFSDYGILLRGDSATVYPELDQKSYNEDAYVFWDTATFRTDNSGKITGGNENHDSNTLISSVKLIGDSESESSEPIGVKNEDSGKTRWNTNNASRLKDYFPQATANWNGIQRGTLTITPADGYYVTGVVIACAGMRNSEGENYISGTNVYSCNTWREGNAFTTSFSVGTSGMVTINLDSEDFSHSSGSKAYFILISVSPVPTPLYVEYNYGAIATILGDDFGNSAFADADEWMTVSNDNVYVPTGSSVTSQAGVQTADTQFKYMYNNGGNSSETASSWRHYANTITAGAKAEAAAAGYYFAGWYAEYYTGITVNKASSEAYNNYDYNFTASTYYGSATYSESDRVYLYTNVKLTAIWKPIELKVTKTVAGLSNAFNNDIASYVLTVQKQGTEAWTDIETVTIGVIGNNSNSTTLKGTDYYSYAEDGQLTLKTTADEGAVVITPGTYRVVESAESQGTRTVGTGDNAVTYYFDSVAYGGNASITADSIINGLTSYSLTVTNTYSEKSTASLIIVKNIYGLTREQVVGLIDGTYRTDDTSGLKFDIDYFDNQQDAAEDAEENKGDWTFGADQTLTINTSNFLENGIWDGDIRTGATDIITQEELSHYSESSLTEVTDQEGNLLYYQYTITISGLDLEDWYHVWETHVDVTGYDLDSSVVATDANGETLENLDTENHINRATVFQLTGDTTVTFTNKYTTRLTVHKTDSADETKNLKGAGFQLYYTATDAEGTPATYYYDSDNETGWTTDPSEAETVYTDDDGNLTFVDLYKLAFVNTDTFYLKETVAPDGYQLLEHVYTIKLDAANPDGDLKVTYNGTPVTVTAGDSGFSITITNTTGQILPETGGAGMTYMTISGLLIMAAAIGGGYVLRRRRGREGN